jgi:hypothetical protein
MSTRIPPDADVVHDDFEELPPEAPAASIVSTPAEQRPAGAATLDSPAEKGAKKKETAKEPDLPPEPKIYGESRIDRASSLLLSIIIGSVFFVGWLFLRLITERSYAKLPDSRIEIVEVVGGTGGSPDVDPNARAEINVAGGDPSKFASNNMEDASEFEEPQVETTNQVVIDAFVEQPPGQTSEVDMAEALPNAGPVASGRRSSKMGNSPIGYGFGGGPGDGGVAREQRWVIVFAVEQKTADEYARQLDYFKIELGVPSGASSIEYASNLAGSGTRRTGLAKADKRLFFIWQGQGRKAVDVQLLQRAGIQVGNRPIFQFYPPDVEDALSQLEVRFAGRQPAQIRSTRFQVVTVGNGYEFRVVSQEPLRQ